MRTRHSLQTLVKYLDYKSHARYLLSRHPDMCAYTCLLGTRARLFASAAAGEQVSSKGDKGRRDRGRRGGRADAKKKVEKARASTDVILARSTRSDARWSCPVYPNYLLSRQIRMHRLHFTVTFYPFFRLPLPTVDDALHVETPPKRVSSMSLSTSQRYTWITQGELCYSMANVALCPRIIMTNYCALRSIYSTLHISQRLS